MKKRKKSKYNVKCILKSKVNRGRWGSVGTSPRSFIHVNYVNVETLQFFSRKKRLLDLRNFLILSDFCAGKGWAFREEALVHLQECTKASKRTCRNYLKRLSVCNMIMAGENDTFAILGKGRLNEAIGGETRCCLSIPVDTYKKGHISLFSDEVRMALIEFKQAKLKYSETRNGQRYNKEAPTGQSHKLEGLKAQYRHHLTLEQVGISVGLISQELGISVGAVCNLKAKYRNSFKEVYVELIQDKKWKEIEAFLNNYLDDPLYGAIRTDQIHTECGGGKIWVAYLRYPDVCISNLSNTKLRPYKHKKRMLNAFIDLSELCTGITKPVTDDVLRPERIRRYMKRR